MEDAPIMNESYSTEQRYFIDVLAAVIHRKDVPLVPKPFDWELFYNLCRLHNLSAMVGFGLKNELETMPQSVLDLFERDVQSGIFYEAKRTYEMERLFSLFDKSKIPYIPLKGYSIRELYPQPQFRTMGDVDILVKKEDLKIFFEILNQEGYSCQHQTNRHVSFFKPPQMDIEIHHTFYHELDRVFTNGRPDYYGNEQVWNRIHRRRGCFRCDQNQTDFFLTFFLHLVRHFMGRGIGVRYILDYMVIKRQRDNPLCKPEVIEQLSRLNLMKFAVHIDRLADIWFSNAVSSPFYDRLALVILNNPVHGGGPDLPSLRLGNLHLNHQGGTFKSKWALIQSYFFPSLIQMKVNYPRMASSVFLLPFCYPRWIILRLFRFRLWKHYINMLATVFRISSSEILEQTAFYKELGLNDSATKE